MQGSAGESVVYLNENMMTVPLKKMIVLRGANGTYTMEQLNERYGKIEN